MSHADEPRMARRTVVKLLAALLAAPAVVTASSKGGGAAKPGPRGTHADPALLEPVVPWALTLSEDELATLAVLCDLIIPADDASPAASAIGAHRFVDEWVSAPWDSHREDAGLVRDGLGWIDGEARRRGGVRFRELGSDAQASLCDAIAHAPDAAPDHELGARFFDKVRRLTLMAFYTSPEGMADLRYVGNVPLAAWEPPPIEVLRRAGLA